ncbi:competence type IV pilus major pilin ComGC [Laceyella putida]|uniref:Competence type IV pilus major pilin ComGC n=1 Tax=Laceyella putida TaxID=110101 RepID=A0ABW2RMS5_9BACL
MRRHGRLCQAMDGERGFTLMEMILVVFIIGVILAIAIPNLRAAGEKAKRQADRANRHMISAQADNYYLEYGEYPSEVEELVKRGYLRSAPKCPFGKKYQIRRSPQLTADQRVVCVK